MHTETERRQDEAEARLRAMILKELCEAMHATNLPPLAVLRLAARSIGSIYREMADAHLGFDRCACGWRPHTTDVELLCMALMTACTQRRSADLRLMRVEGNA
ncbi:hypothetical protein [Mesorhizobium sp. 1M-11]|uniref:hypothetical protein n=1 Tax=Mesorhizobium sp. 1M-11 TaxID=1529006 RepID=UPI0006C7393D|nr:hypothetical protein [Mesorhizobium sp. 1M-11]